MNKINLKNFYLNLVIILVVFIFDRATKLYILKLAEVETSVDIYITPFLNLFLIWNKGIAFGLFSIDGSVIYNFITVLIGLIIIVIIFMMLKNNDSVTVITNDVQKRLGNYYNGFNSNDLISIVNYKDFKYDSTDKRKIILFLNESISCNMFGYKHQLF